MEQETTLRSIRKNKKFNWKPEFYVDTYEQYFAPLRHQPVALLELGVAMGGSLEIWSEYFANGRIAGVDLKVPLVPTGEQGKYKPYVFEGKNIEFFQGSQDDAALMERATAAIAPSGWDIIIDDCSHIGRLSLASFHVLFDKLKPGGLYILEDWGAGYWHNFPDGKLFEPSQHLTVGDDGVFPSHRTGMPGFVKQWVDEIAAADIYQPKNGLAEGSRPSRFRFVHVYHGVVVAKKR